MKKISLFGILLLSVFGCGNGNKDTLKEAGEVFKDAYRTQWRDYKLSSGKAKQSIKTYLGEKYSVIWKGDTNADDVIEYFVVKKSIQYHKGTIKGLLVDDNGKVYMYYDTEKGFSSQGRLFFNFKRMGLKRNDVAVIRLLFESKKIKLTREDYKKKIKGLNLVGEKYFGTVSGFAFQLIDHKGNLIGTSPFLKKTRKRSAVFIVAKVNDLYKDKAKVSYSIFDPHGEGAYKYYRNWVSIYRKNKNKGIVVKAINIKP